MITTATFSEAYADVAADVRAGADLPGLESILREVVNDPQNATGGNVAAFLLEYVIAAIEYAPEPTPVRAADRPTLADAPALANGFYTVCLNGERDRVTLKISDDFRAGSTAKVAAFLAGPDNGADYIGFAFVNGGAVQTWSRFRGGYARQQSALAILVGSETRGEYALAYAVESGRCARCGRLLTVPASVHQGYGPECIKKMQG